MGELVLACFVAIGFITATSLVLVNSLGASIHHKNDGKYQYGTSAGVEKENSEISKSGLFHIFYYGSYFSNTK